MTDGFETRSVHAGQDPDPATGAVVTPISLATTFAQAGVNDHAGFEYARTANPTRQSIRCEASFGTSVTPARLGSASAAKAYVTSVTNASSA